MTPRKGAPVADWCGVPELHSASSAPASQRKLTPRSRATCSSGSVMVATSVFSRPSERLQNWSAHDWPCTSSLSHIPIVRFPSPLLLLPTIIRQRKSGSTLLQISAWLVVVSGKALHTEVNRIGFPLVPIRTFPATSSVSFGAPAPGPTRRSPNAPVPVTAVVPATDKVPLTV